jgi:hypothetical protein
MLLTAEKGHKRKCRHNLRGRVQLVPVAVVL